MARGPKLDRRRITKLAAVWILAMFAWSLIAAPASTGADEEIVEPDEISSYYTFADAVPIVSYADHQALPAPATGPGLAHSSTEVALPSEASAIAWLVDGGLANGLHGTTTGASVPTEVSAKQPGGASQAEFTTAGGPVGEDEFGRVAGGVARATATRSDAPRGFANSYLGNVYLFPAAGSPPEAPGTYDPDATFPGGENTQPIPDPAPRSQMAILSIGSVASTSESIRQNDTVTSIAVAEVNGLNIGNRTSDNRCTNCFNIDAIRVEAYARSNGQPGGSRAGYRVMLGRACRRTFEPGLTDQAREMVEGRLGLDSEEVPARELDQCLQPGDPRTGEYTLKEVDTDQLNEFFAKPAIIYDAAGYTIAIRITVGKVGHADQKRTERTSSPPEDACRNYAYPDPEPEPDARVEECKNLPPEIRPKTGPDRDNGQEAKAVAEGIDIDILTLTGTQLIPEDADLDACFDLDIPDEVGCPIPSIRQVRTLNITLGVAQAGAVARPGFPTDDGGSDGGSDGGILPPIDGGTDGGILPPVDVGPGNGGGVTVVGGGGLGAGKYALKIDWKSLKLKPWAAKDMAKGFLTVGIIGGMVALIRRRLRLT